jgi:hypothetical protein
MNAQPNEVQRLIARVSAGQLDDLSPDEVQLLEVALNEDDALAATLAEVPAGGDWPEALTPTDAEWESVWAGVSSESVSQRGRNGWLRPVGIAAAVLLLIGAWWSGSESESVDPWQIQPDTDFELVALESGSGEIPFVMTGEEDEFPVIWVIDSEGA